MSVVNFPKRPFRQELVKPDEMYAQREPSDAMVWEVCPYLRQHAKDMRCHGCPREEVDPDHGPVTRGCYLMAREACRVLFAMQARENV